MYRKLLTDNPMTAPDIARKFGYSAEGAAGTIRRYAAKGWVKCVGKAKLPNGRSPNLWVWVDSAKSVEHQPAKR